MNPPAPKSVRVGRVEVELTNRGWYAIDGDAENDDVTVAFYLKSYWRARIRLEGSLVEASADTPQAAADALTERLRALRDAIEEVL